MDDKGRLEGVEMGLLKEMEKESMKGVYWVPGGGRDVPKASGLGGCRGLGGPLATNLGPPSLIFLIFLRTLDMSRNAAIATL